MIVFKKTKEYYNELNIFKPDRQNGRGFDMDLLSIDTVYHRVGDMNNVTYASRDWVIKGTWLTSRLQRLLGVN